MTRCENDGAPLLSVVQAVVATHGERRAEGRPSPVAPGGSATGASDREAEGQLVAKPGAATAV